jgi:hypothetical protein
MTEPNEGGSSSRRAGFVALQQGAGATASASLTKASKTKTGARLDLYAGLIASKSPA